MKRPDISVLMPTYNHSSFIRRAIESLCRQSYSHWELIIVDDGSPDDTCHVVEPYLGDERIAYHRLPENCGLGNALNFALARSQAPFIAYLPSDDVYYPEHLSSVRECLEEHPEAVVAYSGVRHHYNRSAPGMIEGNCLQLVQVLHRRTADRWVSRKELVSDDLERLFWSRLRAHGSFVGTGQVTCEWVDHAGQLHKLLQEPRGGINSFRRHFNVPYPLRFHSTEGHYIDEVELYRRFRERPDTPPTEDSLKIVLAGELAYNAERVLALEEQGHRLYGLWMPNPYWYNTVGPLPFGHVREIAHDDWRSELRKIQPDVIYAQLNWQAVPFIWEVVNANLDIPIVWHFKEGPFICLEKGMWDMLVDVYRGASGHIFCNEETREWFETAIPGITRSHRSMLLDGDLPKREWLAGERATPVSQQQGGLHTVVPGRPIGLHPHNVAELAEHDVHLHFYGDFTQKQWKKWIEKAEPVAPNHLHLHSQVDQSGWVREFSRYDAGWLHWIQSDNGGDIRRANWDDLNYPARLSTLVLAGLPVLQYDNEDALVATQSLGKRRDISLFFKCIDELSEKLRDAARMEQLRQNVWNQRQEFTFDYHVERLVSFFRQIADRHRK